MTRAIVIGAGIGGLVTAARLARAGLGVTVLEAHIYPGGCAGTFYHQGYRFDAGATLAGGFYPGGPMDLVAQAVGLRQWPARLSDPAMVVHLPDGSQITRWADERRWSERRAAFGPQSDPFWRWQEQTAAALWDLALQRPPWPPQTPRESLGLVQQGLAWLGRDPGRRLRPALLADAFRPVAAHLDGASERLRLFVDAQLLIAAQTTSRHANALYGASALDLPRRGVVHLAGGMGTIADTLAQAVEKQGGRILYRHKASRIVMERGRPVAVETTRRQRTERFPADLVVANLTPWNIAALLGKDAPPALSQLPPQPRDGWGAFTIHAGLDQTSIAGDLPLHHQIVVQEPLTEGNTIFLSLSPAWDTSRSPAGRRAVTLSTHTKLAEWWRLFDQDRGAYEARKEAYTARIITAVEKALPGLWTRAELVLPGTPITFERFTGRVGGWVGGFPQTSLFRAWGPRLASNLWLVGDSIFPGQSTAAVALGGLRVAETILAEQKLAGWVDQPRYWPESHGATR